MFDGRVVYFVRREGSIIKYSLLESFNVSSLIITCVDRDANHIYIKVPCNFSNGSCLIKKLACFSPCTTLNQK